MIDERVQCGIQGPLFLSCRGGKFVSEYTNASMNKTVYNYKHGERWYYVFKCTIGYGNKLKFIATCVILCESLSTNQERLDCILEF